MMGRQEVAQAPLFYSFNLDAHIPANHLLRGVDHFLDLSELHQHLAPHYSNTGRPSIDPALLIRMLVVGYCFGIRSERQLCEEVHLNLAYRWFCRLGLEDKVPDHMRVIYLDAILYFLGGLIGTGHHWYFTGHVQFNMALSALFSVLEVVPLTLLTLDAWDFVHTTKGQVDVDGKPRRVPHKWTFYFLMAVGFWNFVGAGMFGFLINLPIVSYYEVGTQLTPNHGHAALMGVFGMLALALMTFVLRQTADDRSWPGIEKYIKYGFWGTNIGLAMMIVMSLFPSGVLQLIDVVENGYWHARSIDFIATPRARLIEWLRLPGDLVFIIFGAIPMLIAAIKAWQGVRGRTAASRSAGGVARQ